MLRFLVGLVLALLSVLMGIALFGGKAHLWLQPLFGALLFVVALPGCAALAIWTRQELSQAFLDAMRGAANSGARASSAKIWSAFEAFFYLGGFIGLLSGLVITLNLLTYDPAILGCKLAASLITPFYGVLLAVTARILRLRVERDYK